jgi:anti-sigma factor RsiW
MTHVTDRLQRYVDGEMAAAEAREVEAHLQTCRACRDEWTAVRALWQTVDAAAPAAPTVVLWPHLAARLAARRRGASSPWLRGSLAAAALAAGLMLGLGMNHTGQSAAPEVAASDDEDGFLQTLTTLDQIWWSAGAQDDAEVGS